MSEVVKADEFERYLEIYEIGHAMMNEHGLIEKGWTFEINNSKRIMGLCKHNIKTLNFSGNFLRSDMSEIKNCILHEIAHALAGPGHGHDSYWKAVARSIGCTGDRCYEVEDVVNIAKPQFYLQCPTCNRKWMRFRIKRSLIGRPSRCCKAPLKAFKINR